MSGPAVPGGFGPREAMPMDNFMSGAFDVLNGLFDEGKRKDLPPAMQEILEADKRVAEAAARFAATEDGRVILEWLCDQTLRRPTFFSHLGLDPMQAYAHGCFREGANAIVFSLLKAIATGRQEHPPHREGS